MKKSIFIITLLISSTAFAQCPVEPSCTQTVSLTGPALTNTSYNSSVCFQGYGTISSSVNVNNWDYLKFDAYQGTLNVVETINYQGSKIWVGTDQFSIVQFNRISMNGNDTMICRPGANIDITDLIGNNSGNVILKNSANALRINGVYRNVGDVVQGILIANCVGQPLPILNLQLKKDWLMWQCEGTEIKVQYCNDGKNFSTIYTTNIEQGTYQISESGFYRIQVDEQYSHIIEYKMTKLEKPKLYFDIKTRTLSPNKPQNVNYYGIKN